MKPPPSIIVHGLDHARTALAPGLPVTLLSAPGAGIYAGVGWWRALMQAATPHATADFADILDCGAAPGRALQALRAGQMRLILRADPTIWSDIAARAAALGAVLASEAPPALDLALPGASRRLIDWLKQAS